jgi:hypothetical protein
MHLPAASRPTRVRRLLAVSAAAAFVMIGPTACDYGAYSGGSSDGYAAGGQAESSDGDNVVPVGNSSPSTEESRRDRWQNRYVSNGGGDDGDGGDNEQPAATATTAPAAEPTDPAATPDPAAPVGSPAPGDPAVTGTAAPTESASATETAAPGGANGFDAVPPLDGGAKGANNGLDVLGRDCTNSGLPPHTGFQEAKAQCVETAMGAVADENNLPSLLITDAPKEVAVGQAFELKVSTRNLVRDRFLGAAAGGYYLEASFLDGKGLQRGHFHTACRILPSTGEAPDSKGAPDFFVATQDNGGGKAPDTVTINVPGIKSAGELQCTSWAGDGSHRTPMMSRANQTPAIDSVRITVGGNGQAAAPAENGNAAGGAAESQVPQPPAEGAQGQEGAGATAENNGAGSGAENEGGNNGAGESAEATAEETSEAEVAEVTNNDTAEASASTAGAGSGS